ncbi:flavin reductase [Acetobacter sacchari]|uniref:Flavin reductase n=1 Tax=Acetobacter sacchari TaxID=2661687 RepID=A0ABS3LZZ4_9PROT|nr:flavin reductase [Acetobacter sacchari]MBO1361478.1 flavin reductase [Acetobacter sacchari]
MNTAHEQQRRTSGVKSAQLEFRAAMARVGASVNVITSAGSAGRGGFTATAMCSVSDDPPTLLVCMNRRSAQCDLFLQNKVFCVNVLGHEHVDLAGYFAGKVADMEERYASGMWEKLPSGNLALTGAIASFDCKIAAHHVVGTHYVIFGEVQDIRCSAVGHPLLYLDRAFVGATVGVAPN